MGYSLERKAVVLKRMLPPNNMAIRRLSQAEGISEATLHKWRAEARGKGQLLPDAVAGPEGWSSRDKFAAVLETAALNEADLAEYCRKRGLYPALDDDGVAQAYIRTVRRRGHRFETPVQRSGKLVASQQPLGFGPEPRDQHRRRFDHVNMLYPGPGIKTAGAHIAQSSAIGLIVRITQHGVAVLVKQDIALARAMWRGRVASRFPGFQSAVAQDAMKGKRPGQIETDGKTRVAATCR